MTLGQRLKEHRQRSKLSQEAVAELVGVSRQAVTKWEADQSSPSTENLFRLAQLYNTTVDELVTDRKQDSQSVAEEMYRLFRTEEEQRHALARKQRRSRLCTTLIMTAVWLALFLLGRLVWGLREGCSFMGWLTSWQSTCYVFGWLLSSRLYWWSMAVGVLPALWGKWRFSAVTCAGFVCGVLLGEWLGPYPAGVPYGHSHYGWAICGGVFLVSIALGIGTEWARKPKKGEE